MDYYLLEKVASSITKITDITGVYAYLIEGNNKAALIDTCCGIGDISLIVKGISNLPVTVICTHGHVDHAGGTFGFDDVYLSRSDLGLVQEHTTVDFRKCYVDSFVTPDSYALTDFVPQRKADYQQLENRSLFDLGGITLEAVSVQGHTQGMTCVLIKELRTLIIGDACNSRTFLFFPEASSVEQYKQNLLALKNEDKKFDTVWFSHGNYSGDKTVIDEAIALCGEIMAGSSDNIEFEFMGEVAYLAKKTDQNYSRLDGKTANIVFNPKRVFEKH